jgi:hypothetical protein
MGGISTFFMILEHLRFEGDGTIPYCHDQHTIKWSLTQGTRIYVIYGWGSQRFLKYLGTSCLRGTGPPYGHDLHAIRCYLTQETRMYIV